MTSSRSIATVRLDVGIVDITAPRALRTASERLHVAPGTQPGAALADALARSRLLRPGRVRHTRVLLETSRVLFAAETGVVAGAVAEGGARCGLTLARPLIAVLPQDLQTALLGVLEHRRVSGPATVELGPLARAAAGLSPMDGTAAGTAAGLVIDRSNAAVTVLLLGKEGVLWGRSVPATDPLLAARLLIDRAQSLLPPAIGLRWWRISDVASHDDPRRVQRDAREFEAAAAAELEGVPLRHTVRA